MNTLTMPLKIIALLLVIVGNVMFATSVTGVGNVTVDMADGDSFADNSGEHQMVAIGTQSITKQGIGTYTLNHTYDVLNTITVSEGTLILNAINSATPFNITVGSGATLEAKNANSFSNLSLVTVEDGGRLEITQSMTIDASQLSLATGAIMDINRENLDFQLSNSTDMDNILGTITWERDTNFNFIGSMDGTFRGLIDSSKEVSYFFNNSTAILTVTNSLEHYIGRMRANSNIILQTDSDYTYGGRILNGSGRVIKQGNGTITLTSTHSMAQGTLQIEQGAIQLEGKAKTVYLSGGTLLANGNIYDDLFFENETSPLKGLINGSGNHLTVENFNAPSSRGLIQVDIDIAEAIANGITNAISHSYFEVTGDNQTIDLSLFDLEVQVIGLSEDLTDQNYTLATHSGSNSVFANPENANLTVLSSDSSYSGTLSAPGGTNLQLNLVKIETGADIFLTDGSATALSSSLSSNNPTFFISSYFSDGALNADAQNSVNLGNDQEIKIHGLQELLAVFDSRIRTIDMTGTLAMENTAKLKLFMPANNLTAAEGFRLSSATISLPTIGQAELHIHAGLLVLPSELPMDNIYVVSQHANALLSGAVETSATLVLNENLTIVDASPIRTLEGWLRGDKALIIPSNTITYLKTLHSPKYFYGTVDWSAGATVTLWQAVGKNATFSPKSDQTYIVENAGDFGRIKPIGTTKDCIIDFYDNVVITHLDLSEGDITLNINKDKKIILGQITTIERLARLNITGQGSVEMSLVPSKVKNTVSSDTTLKVLNGQTVVRETIIPPIEDLEEDI